VSEGRPLLSVLLILRYVLAGEMLAELRPYISHLFITIANDARYSVFVISDRILSVNTPLKTPVTARLRCLATRSGATDLSSCRLSIRSKLKIHTYRIAKCG